MYNLLVWIGDTRFSVQSDGTLVPHILGGGALTLIQALELRATHQHSHIYGADGVKWVPTPSTRDRRFV